MQTLNLIVALCCLTGTVFAAPATQPSVANDLVINNDHYRLRIDAATGELAAFSHPMRELLAPGSAGRAMVRLRFRDAQGTPLDLNTTEAQQIHVTQQSAPSGPVVHIDYLRLRNLSVNVQVEVRCPAKERFTYWRATVTHDLDQYLDWMEFPAVSVPNDLIATGGENRLFWPGMEGVVVEDTARREHSWLPYHPIEFPNRGWEGYYPGPCQMQFMALYGPRGGLYLAAHDAGGFPKGIEFHAHDAVIDLEYRLYPGAIPRGTFAMNYDMVLGTFDGDWHDAAEIYRTWVEASGRPLPAKLAVDTSLPRWYGESPVVVSYPVRGTRDLGDMSPNEYYPYTHALAALDRLGTGFDSPILALLMHWEGSAPWAPPYVWPPYGDEKDFEAFTNGLHTKGNLLGLYCSGMAWTQKSNLWPYNREEQFEREHLRDIMIAAPNGEVPWSLICSGPNAQRWSYDMCPANAFVGRTVAGEIEKMAAHNVDYVQYFDQNLGGTSYFCYARNHGHPPAPGPWMNDAVRDVLTQARAAADKAHHPLMIGCEAAAAEPYQNFLRFNDARANINLFVGTPVPAYAYVYHEYVNNFMGNQNGVAAMVDFDRSPLNLLQRLTYGFVAGDMLTVVLKDNGQIHWDWGTAWTVPGPDQNQTVTLIRNLNAWRRGIGKPFLHLGRMVEPWKLEGLHDVPMVLRQGGVLHWPSMMTSRWLSPDGRDAQVIANYLPEAQDCRVHVPAETTNLRVYQNPATSAPTPVANPGNGTPITIPALSAVLVEAYSQ